MRSLVLAGLLVAGVAGCGSGSRTTTVTTAARPTEAFYPGDCGHEQIAPVRIFTACGTGQGGVDKIIWTGWGNVVAEGHGFAYLDDCVPDCVSGGIHYAGAEVYLSAPKECPNGARQYTHMTIAVARGPSIASKIAGTYSVSCGVPGRPTVNLAAAAPG